MAARNQSPWWSSPWAIAGGLLLGSGIAAMLHRRRQPTADCTQVGADEGTVAGIHYLERVRGDASPDDALPMVVVFHSRGGVPAGVAKTLQDVGRARLIIPRGSFQLGSGWAWFDKPIRGAIEQGDPSVALQLNEVAMQVAEFLRQIVQCRPTVGQPILTGSSQGGEMALLLGSTHPDLAHSAIAVNGLLLPAFWDPGIVPTAMINGTGDEVVPFDWAAEYAQAMIDAGAPLSFTPFPSTGHGVTEPMASAWHDLVRVSAQGLLQ